MVMEIVPVFATELIEAEEEKRRLENLSETHAFQRFGETFGFRVVVVGEKAYTTAKEVMDVFGYSDYRKVHHFLKRHGMKTYTFEEITHEVIETQGSNQCAQDGHIGQKPDIQQFEKVIRETFGLYHTPSLYRVRFIDYKGFLLLGMYSQAENGDVVRVYLIEAERELRRRFIEELKRLRGEDELLLRFKTYSPYIDKVDRIIRRLPKKKQEIAAEELLKRIFGKDIFGSEKSEEEKKEDLRRRIVQAVMFLEDFRDFKLKDGYVWIPGYRFMEVLKKAGLSRDKRVVKKVRDALGLAKKRTVDFNYTLIPIDFFPADFLNRLEA